MDEFQREAEDVPCNLKLQSAREEQNGDKVPLDKIMFAENEICTFGVYQNLLQNLYKVSDVFMVTAKVYMIGFYLLHAFMCLWDLVCLLNIYALESRGYNLVSTETTLFVQHMEWIIWFTLLN